MSTFLRMSSYHSSWFPPQVTLIPPKKLHRSTTFWVKTMCFSRKNTSSSQQSQVDSGNVRLESLDHVMQTTFDLVQYVGHWPGVIYGATWWHSVSWYGDCIHLHTEKDTNTEESFHGQCIYFITYHKLITYCKLTTLLTRCTMVTNDGWIWFSMCLL